MIYIVRKVRGVARLLFMALTLVLFLGFFFVQVPFAKNTQRLGLSMRRRFVKTVMWLLGVRITSTGTPQHAPGIIIGNHISYLDPIAVLAFQEAWPVAKAEVASWPLIGWATQQTGILFVKRESKSSRADTLKAMEKALHDGIQILIYPEGTTQQAGPTMPFRPGAFRLAAKEGFPIFPVAITYDNPLAAFVGTDTFLPHFLKVFGTRRLRASLHFGPPVIHSDPDELRQQCQAWIDACIKGMLAP